MEGLQIDVATLGWLLFAAAGASSVLTLILVAILGHYVVAPRVERKIDRRLEEGAQRLEENLRKRFMDLLTGRPREVLRDRTRDLARGMGLIGGARRPPPDDPDDDLDR
jgi:ABC-type transport system involved in cytochrome bd biosynthesis fused ATPase/permease subunit